MDEVRSDVGNFNCTIQELKLEIVIVPVRGWSFQLHHTGIKT